MIYEIKGMSKVKDLFESWQESLVIKDDIGFSIPGITAMLLQQ